jgi:uncharacterized protein YaiL (DUF2058 family)
MGLSIQEQLLKAGMVDKKQVKKAEHDKRMQVKKKRQAGNFLENKDSLRLRQQQAEQAKQDLKLNTERNQQAQLKADQAAAKQLIETNQSPVVEGDAVYHYVDGGQIKRISVSQDIADKLSDGRLGLVRHKRDFVLLPAETVLKVLQRDKDLILAYNDPAHIDDDYPTDW